MLLMDRQAGAAGTIAGAISGVDYVGKLEGELESVYGRAVVCVNSADAAVHTALYLCGVTAGDRVFVPSYTFYSRVAAVCGFGAEPVFIDCEPTGRCVSAAALEAALVWAELQGKPPKAVVIDNAFGSRADFAALCPLCKSFGAAVIELACDALGGGDARPSGSDGDYAVLSFSKRIAGGGGALLLNDGKRAAEEFIRARYSEGENHDYKMHNVIAALNYAQLPDIPKIAARARANLAAVCACTESAIKPVSGDSGAYACCKLTGKDAARIAELGYKVMTPPPAHTLPKYRGCVYFEHERGYSVCESLAASSCLIDMDMSTFKRLKLCRELAALDNTRAGIYNVKS